MMCHHEKAKPTKSEVRTDDTVKTTWTCKLCFKEIEYIVTPYDLRYSGNTTPDMRNYNGGNKARRNRKR